MARKPPDTPWQFPKKCPLQRQVGHLWEMARAPYCGWTKSCTTWKPWLELVFTGIYRGIIKNQGFLGGAKWTLSIHSIRRDQTSPHPRAGHPRPSLQPPAAAWCCGRAAPTAPGPRRGPDEKMRFPHGFRWTTKGVVLKPFARKLATPLKGNPSLRGGRNICQKRWQKDPPFDKTKTPETFFFLQIAVNICSEVKKIGLSPMGLNWLWWLKLRAGPPPPCPPK